MMFRTLLLTSLLALAACGSRTSASLSPTTGTSPVATADAASHPPQDQIPIMTGDITDRPYRSLGDISVTVAKWTVFDADPTPAAIDRALRVKAAGVHADAVILVRYGTVGIGLLTYGKLDGRGRAIAYAQ